MKVSMIAAIGRNRELGKDNKIPWSIPEDSKWFREKTAGHVVIMGRKTYESIGQPLPKRFNIIVTRDPKYIVQGAVVVHSLDEAIQLGKEKEPSVADAYAKEPEVFIMGGAQIYQEGLPYADRLYITKIDQEFDADAFFPQYPDFENIISEKRGQSGEYTYSFLVLDRSN